MNKENLIKELKKLFKSMDYIADNFLSKRNISQRNVTAFYNIYQQLGSLWQFLGSQCRHWDGYKRKDDKWSCKICGKVKGAKEDYYVLPVDGKKVIGRMVGPGKNKSERLSKNEAEIINDTIKFHGAKLNISVFNGYKSRLGKDMNVAADRIVTLEEDGLIIDISNGKNPQ